MLLKFRPVLVALTTLLLVAVPVSAQTVNETFKLVASDGAADHNFGYSVSIDSGIIVVGAPHDNDNGADSGSAYLFSAVSGAELGKLVPADGAPGDQFGFSVAIRGNIVAVGAMSDEHEGTASGSAYLFDASTGAQLAKLTPADGATGDEFGFAIATDGVVVAVGAKRRDDSGTDSGAVYLYDVATGSQIDKLLANDGTANDNFGESVAIDDGVIAIGAHGDWASGPLSGSAYLFDATSGDQLFKLVAENGATSDFFGTAIDIDDGLVAVGAWAKSVVFDHSGAAYVFDAATGSQVRYIIPADGHDRDNFGHSISIDNGVVAIGAHQDGDNGPNSGSAYLFDALTGTQIDKLLASDGAVFDRLGSSIAIDNGLVATGAIGDEDNGSDSGSVYVFGSMESIDTDSDGVSDSIDNCTAVQNASQEDSDADGHGNACDADFDQNCITNFSDISLFAAQFAGVNALYDLNSDGAVNFLDFAIVADHFLMPPGAGANGVCAD